MIDFNNIWIDIQCPKCNYLDEIQLTDIKSEVTIFCHNCKIKIRLIDEESSVHTSSENINNELKELGNLFKNFGK